MVAGNGKWQQPWPDTVAKLAKRVDGVGVSLVHGTTVVDGMDPPTASSGACPMVLGVVEWDIIAEIWTGVVPVLTKVPEEALKAVELMEVAEHKVDVEIAAIV